MPTYPIGITRSFGTWQSNANSIERSTDNAAYDAAHGDNCLILAGPARKEVASTVGNGRTMRALGHSQQFAFSSSAPVQAAQGIGSARSFFLRGKSQSQWQCTRLLLNGLNLLAAMYHSAREAGIALDQFDDPAAPQNNPQSQFVINLDSELFSIPMGWGLTMRSKSHTLIGGCYLELCMVQSWGTQITAGSPMIAESVSGLCDRILHYQVSDAMNAPRVGRALMDAVLGMGQTPLSPANYTTFSGIPSTGLGSSVVPGL